MGPSRGIFEEDDFDNVSPDHLAVGGVALFNGLPSGPSELCYSLQFHATGPAGVIPNGLSVQPYFYYPSWTWTFTEQGSGQSYPPDYCTFPITDMYDPVAPPENFNIVGPAVCGDVDCSSAVDIDDVVYLISYIFSSGPPPCDPDDDGTPNCGK